MRIIAALIALCLSPFASGEMRLVCNGDYTAEIDHLSSTTSRKVTVYLNVEGQPQTLRWGTKTVEVRPILDGEYYSGRKKTPTELIVMDLHRETLEFGAIIIGQGTVEFEGICELSEFKPKI